jgi:hypothetical protein
LDFARVVYAAWDRHCVIVQGFGATAMWDSLGRCDACFEGCGGFLVDGDTIRGFMHKWSPAEKARAWVDKTWSTTVCELMGATCWANALGRFVQNTRVQLEMDCDPAVVDIQKAFSATPAVMECVTEFRLSIARSSVHLRARHVLGKIYNVISDCLSRDDLPQARSHALKVFGMDLVMV